MIDTPAHLQQRMRLLLPGFLPRIEIIYRHLLHVTEVPGEAPGHFE
jgi:hypothetical protein